MDRDHRFGHAGNTNVRHTPAQGRRATTLFEVAVSLLVLAIAVTAALAIFPVGIRAQQQARFQLYAGTMATQMIDAWTQADHSFWRQQIESERLAQNTFVNAPVDFERMLDHSGMGMLPLPNALARRLDSDGDEIARHLGEGGSLYYPTPLPAEIGMDSGYHNTGVGSVGDVAPETQKLVFAVLGYAQQNALPSHPCVAWPYQDWYPSPVQERERLEWREHQPAWTGLVELEAVFSVINAATYESAHRDPGIIDDYIVKAQALAKAAGVTMTGAPPFEAPALPPALPTGTWADGDADVFPPPWRILAMRILAHAAMARTAAFPNAVDDATPAQRAFAVDCHEAALAWATRYASTSIYDWGAPRPLNRQTAFDFPLLQYDLFSPLNTSAPGGDVSHLIGCPLAPNVAPANVWRSHGNYGWNPMPDNRAQIAAGWSDNRAFNLTAPFSASDRTRRIVCWSADWQAYEDFEELPAEATSSDNAFLDSLGVQVSAERTGYPPGAWFHFEDAARSSLFDVALHTRLNQSHYAEWNTATYKAGYLGVHGADRNGDGDFDRGPLPRSARMRATTVVQYDVYDRRLLSGLHY